MHLGEPFVTEEAPGGIDAAHAREFGDHVHQTRSAQADRRLATDDLKVQALVVDGHDLDGPGGCAHAAGDGRCLERRAGGSGRTDESLAVGEDDLAVGADVDEQAQPLVAVHSGRQRTRDDVTTHVGAQRGEDRCARPGMNRYAEVRCSQTFEVGAGQDERGHSERLGIDPEEQLHHGRVARERQLVHLVRGDACLDENVHGEIGQRGLCEVAQAVQGLGVEHGGTDAADDIGAERLLPVEHR